MTGSYNITFSCPHCGQYLEADSDIVGMSVECPGCRKSLIVPSFDSECQKEMSLGTNTKTKNQSTDEVASGNKRPYVRPSIRCREFFSKRNKKRLKAIGIGVGLLLLVIGIGVAILSAVNRGAESILSPENRQVSESIECLLNFMKIPNERRAKVLADSLESCPDEFQIAVCEYLGAMQNDDAENMAIGLVSLLGLAAVEAGADGSTVFSSIQGLKKSAIQRKIEPKRNCLIDVSQKYGIDSNTLEEILISLEP